MDKRYDILYKRLHSLTVEQLQKIIDYKDELVLDNCNYDGNNFCPLAIAFDIPKLLKNQILTDELVRNKIIEIASNQINNFDINPTKNIEGKFYTINRKEDLLSLAKKVLNEKYNKL